MFKVGYGDGSDNDHDTDSRSQFSNHYTPVLNKYSMVIDPVVFHHDNENPSQYVEHLLYDVNDNNQIGLYSYIVGQSFVMCSVKSDTCKSENEWNTLAARYMEVVKS